VTAIARPPGSRVQVQHTGDRLHVVLPPPPAWESLRVLFAGACLVGFVAFPVLAGLAFGPRPFLHLYSSPLLLAAVASLAWWRATGRLRTELTVEGGRLLVVFSGTIRPGRWEWGLHEIGLIGLCPGLRIVGEQTLTLLHDCGEDGLKRVARLLQQAVADNAGRPPAEVAPRPGELEVELADRPEHPPTRWLLDVRPGVLALRPDFLTTPRYTFFAAGARSPGVWWRAWRRCEQPVTPVDLSCRVEEDGSACVRIAGPGRATLYFWCADKGALQHALARFWGAAGRRITKDMDKVKELERMREAWGDKGSNNEPDDLCAVVPYFRTQRARPPTSERTHTMTLCLCLLLVAQCPEPGEPIEGQWKLTGGEYKGQTFDPDVFRKHSMSLLITRSKMVILRDDEKESATYRINAKTNPKQIDIVYSGKKGTNHAIFKLKGNTLVICASNKLLKANKKAERPSYFTSDDKKNKDLRGLTLLEFTRVTKKSSKGK
jgi:uncharacterized protein (TIGR03067 family)